MSRRVADISKRVHRILKFKIASWSKKFECLLDHVPGILEAGEKCSTMDVVELFDEAPLIWGILTLEMTVWKDSDDVLD